MSIRFNVYHDLVCNTYTSRISNSGTLKFRVSPNNNNNKKNWKIRF